MKKRIITGIVMAVIMIPLGFFTDTWALPVFFALMSAVSAYELMLCTKLHRNLWFAVPTYILSFLSPIAARYLGSTFFSAYAPAIIALFLLWNAAVYMFRTAHQDGKETGYESPLSSVCISSFFVLYSTAGYSFLILLNDVPKGGLFLILSVFIMSYVTDMGAYFTGMLFGKHKLIPRISPKKTVEGAVGGVVITAAAMAVYGWIINSIGPDDANILSLVVLGIVGSAVSMVGDLVMSALKRSCGVKDFGWILPGHGGILDRFDSVLAVSIITYAFTRFVYVFGEL